MLLSVTSVEIKGGFRCRFSLTIKDTNDQRNQRRIQLDISDISDVDSKSDVSTQWLPRQPQASPSTHVRDKTSRNWTVDFEIFIVRVSLLSLHGIQFKKIDGDIRDIMQSILWALRL
jgi:hypothetical protein